MDLDSLEWHPELLKLFKISRLNLPQILPSNSHFGETKGVGSLPDGLPITGIVGDQQAALFGQAGFKPADVKCTFGTGSFILFNTGTKKVYSRSKLLTTVAWRLRGAPAIYALEGGAFICGAAVQWLRDGLSIIKKSDEIEELAQSVSDSGGVEFVPALTGLGAPYWEPSATGMISGITRGTTRAHIARATLEAMALQNLEIVEAMEKDIGKKIRRMKVDGGATNNSLLLQIQSDYVGVPVIRPRELETTAYGAGLMAGLGAGVWKNLSEIEKLWKVHKIHEPQMKSALVRQRKERWKKAIKRTLSL